MVDEDILEELPSEDSQREWYSEEDPIYAPLLSAPALSLEENELLDRQARRFLSKWIDEAGGELNIPSTAWGADLRWAIGRLLSATNPLKRVTITLDTTMWNEGFERVDFPWLQFYTDNIAWADALPESYEVPNPENSYFTQPFLVTVESVTGRALQADTTADDWLSSHPDEAQDELAYGFERFPGFLSETADELNRRLVKRIEEWS